MSKEKERTKMKNKVRDLVDEMKDKAMVCFFRASDREMVVQEITKFVLKQNQ